MRLSVSILEIGTFSDFFFQIPAVPPFKRGNEMIISTSGGSLNRGDTQDGTYTRKHPPRIIDGTGLSEAG